MAKIIGKNADFAIGDVNVTPGFAYLYASAGMKRVETLGNDITLNIDQNTDETTAYGDDFKTHEIIDAQWSVDMTLYYSTGTDEVDTLFVAAIIATPFVKKGFVFSPAGKPAGEASATQPRYYGDVIITSVVPNPPRGGVASVRVRLQGSGSLGRAVA